MPPHAEDARMVPVICMNSFLSGGGIDRCLQLRGQWAVGIRTADGINQRFDGAVAVDQRLAEPGYRCAADHIEQSESGNESREVLQYPMPDVDGKIRVALLNGRRAGHAGNNASVIRRQFNRAGAENHHQCANDSERKHQCVRECASGSRFKDGELPFEGALGRFANFMKKEPEMIAIGAEDRLALIVEQWKTNEKEVVVLANDYRGAQRRETFAVIIFEFDFAAQVEMFDRADVRVQTDEKRLHASFVVLEIGFQFHALHKFRGGVSDIEVNVGNRDAIGVALTRRSRAAGLCAGNNIDADDEYGSQQAKPQEQK